MPKFLVSIHRPFGFDHASHITAEVMRAIDDVNDKMVAAGIRVFVAGLRSPSEAKSVRWESDGSTEVGDGPFLDSRHYVDGFWVIEVADRETAVDWGRQAAQACRGSVEVRPIHGP